ncbi:MAG: hypothetical protein CM15mP77_1040 [Synechococcus sp.]|nr:MAG: hypothetical protein CM15mP77_1040 [Synechococcus sp.]
MLAGTPFPEETRCFTRSELMDYYANTAAAQRPAGVERARQATRAREKEHFAAQVLERRAFVRSFSP